MQGHVAAVVAVTRHRFASLLRLVGAPTEVEGLPFVGIVMLAVKALVSANITCFLYSDQHHYKESFYPPVAVAISAALGEGWSGGVVKWGVRVIGGVVRVGMTERLARLQMAFISSG